MKNCIYYIDRKTGERKQEAVYGEKALSLLYKKNFLCRSLAHLICKINLFSKLYGLYQRMPWTKRKIKPFIKKFNINPSEFLLSPELFKSFDHFFTRKLKPGARPIEMGTKCAIIPADGRYYFYQNLEECDGFIIKNQKFSLPKLLGNPKLAEKYRNGSMALARLCPTDYHRFHFPCDGVAGEPQLINGWLFSVNPIAVKKNIEILTENKRVLTEFDTKEFGKVILIEIGATNVGSIHQTFQPGTFCKKGEEKGYFSFGGSALVILFEPDSILFDSDLLENSQTYVETLCHLGQSMGIAFN